MNATLEQIAILRADSVLIDDKLETKYCPDGVVGEHPVFSLSDWRAAVVFGDTLLGYWRWLVDQINDALLEVGDDDIAERQKNQFTEDQNNQTAA